MDRLLTLLSISPTRPVRRSGRDGRSAPTNCGQSLPILLLQVTWEIEFNDMHLNGVRSVPAAWYQFAPVASFDRYN